MDGQMKLSEDYIRVIKFCPALEKLAKSEIWLVFPGFRVRARALRKPLGLNEFNP